MTEGKRSPPAKWKDAEWGATLELVATQLDTPLWKLRPANLPSYLVLCQRIRVDPKLKAKFKAAIVRRKEAFAASGRPWRGAHDGAYSVVAGVKCGRGYRYSDEAYAEYLARFEADRTAKDLVAAQALRWPGLPSFHSVLLRRRSQLRKLVRQKGLVQRPGGDVRPRQRSEEAYNRAIALISIMSRTEYAKHRSSNPAEGLPSATAVLIRAQRDPAFARRLYDVRPKVEMVFYRYDEAAYDAALNKIGQAGWVAYMAERQVGVWPNVSSLYRRAYSDLDFKARFRAKVLEWFGIRRKLRAAERKKTKLPDRPAGQLRGSLLQHEAYRIADKFIPRYYEQADRDDIKSDIVEAVLAGEFSSEEIGENARWFIREHFRHGVFSSGKFGSLDEPFFEDSDVALIDLLTADDHHHIG